MNIDFLSSIGGAFIGSAVTGAISYVLLKMSFDREEARRRDDRVRQQTFVFETIKYKLETIKNESQLSQYHIEKCKNGPKLAAITPAWFWLVGESALPEPQIVTAEEYAMMALLGDPMLTKDVSDIVTSQIGIFMTRKDYGAQRNALLASDPWLFLNFIVPDRLKERHKELEWAVANIDILAQSLIFGIYGIDKLLPTTVSRYSELMNAYLDKEKSSYTGRWALLHS